MKVFTVLCLLVACTAAAKIEKAEPKTEGATISESEYPDSVKEALRDALVDRPKKARQIFETGTYIGRRNGKDEPSENKREGKKEEGSNDVNTEEKAEVETKKKATGAPVSIGQDVGWWPMPIRFGHGQRARSLKPKKSDKSAEKEGEKAGKDGDLESGDDAEKEEGDHKAENSYLLPNFAPAPGGYGGYGGYVGGGGGGYSGYGGYGPYIYILPIVLPPVPQHPRPGHVVTETESHHYSDGPLPLPPSGHGEYHPLYVGSKSVPPIYVPKSYGHPHPHLDTHTTVHHEEGHSNGPIIRDIEPPIFKS